MIKLMELLAFGTGVIIGLLIRDIQARRIESSNERKETNELKGKTQFIEPESAEEKIKKVFNQKS